MQPFFGIYASSALCFGQQLQLFFPAQKQACRANDEQESKSGKSYPFMDVSIDSCGFRKGVACFFQEVEV